jgi:hypothetical protein
MTMPAPKRRKVTLDEGQTLEIAEASGRVTLRVQMTAQGPVVTLEGAILHLEATREIALRAPLVTIDAAERALVASGGTLEVASQGKLTLHADQDDMVLLGKLIHIN